MPTNEYRRNRLLSMADLTVGTGLEIGPMDRPIARKSDLDVRYVDVWDASELRTMHTEAEYSLAEIEELDFVLTDEAGTVRSLTETIGIQGAFGWVLASHVVEHVPNLIGWLREIAGLVDDTGRLVLAVPDRRFTFDANRAQTTVGQILEAHYRNDTRPSVRAVYDFHRDKITATTQDLWSGLKADTSLRNCPLDEVIQYVGQARDGKTYVDSHVWLFTPQVFVEQMTELGDLDLCDFVVERITQTQPGDLEFFVTLRRLPRGLDLAERTSVRAAAIRTFQDAPFGRTAVEEKVDELQGLVTNCLSVLIEKTTVLAQNIGELGRQITQLREEVHGPAEVAEAV